MEGLGRLKGTRFRYKNLFLVGSLLHGGNVIEYFSKHTKKLVVFYLNRTVRGEKNFVHTYYKGSLIHTEQLFTPGTPFVNYFFVYFWYVRIVLTHFSKNEEFYIITYHPLFFAGNTILKRIRNFEVVLWVIDYLPHPSPLLKLYQTLMFYYHKRNRYNLYLADGVNMAMNGIVKDTRYQKTVMWGVQAVEGKARMLLQDIVLGFVGVIRKGHGLDIVFQVVAMDKQIKLKVLGQCKTSLFEKYQLIIKKLGIEQQVTFLNKFYSNEELNQELSTCTIGIALYTVNKSDPIYYTDSGKVKAYTQFGLPVIITNTSAIVPFIKKFHAGEVVHRNKEAVCSAIRKIMKRYYLYKEGVEQFNTHFDYEVYYKRAFAFLEEEKV